MKKFDYFGREAVEFEFDGRRAIVVLADEKVRTGKWLLKTEYFEAFPDTELHLVDRGYNIAYLDNLNRWGVDADMDAKADFAAFLRKEYGFEPKCVPVGMSCGGLHAVNLAARHPEMVSVMYLDAPLLDFLSYPLCLGESKAYDENVWEELKAAYGFEKKSEVLHFRRHPLDNIPVLVQNRIPFIMLWGEIDTTLPYDENGMLLQKAYENTDIPHEIIMKPNCAHHPHGMADDSRVIEFIERYS